MHDWASVCSVCSSENVSVNDDAQSGDSLTEPDFVKDEIVSRPSPNNKFVLDLAIFQIYVPFSADHMMFFNFQHSAENNKNNLLMEDCMAVI